MTEQMHRPGSQNSQGRWQAKKLPWIKGVPKTLLGNLSYRQRVETAAKDLRQVPLLRKMCKEDPLFFLNAFAWTYDNRKKPSGIPFITWPFQDEAFLTLLNSIETGEDILIEKSRDMGASWLCLMAFTWSWLFEPGRGYLCMSAKEDLVDKPGDPDSLFWKIDFVVNRLPAGVRPMEYRPKLHRKFLHFENPANGSVIDGASTTSDTGRGGRRTAMLLDEFASVPNGREVLAATADATPCRIFNSTPKGTVDAFYEKVCDEGCKKLRLHWTLHPEKAKGQYFGEKGEARSPWYDAQCKRRTAREIAQELDICYISAGSTFFVSQEVEKHIASFGLPPVARGVLLADGETLKPEKFLPDPNGDLFLWLEKPDPAQKYVIGVDIAAGTGIRSSSSVVSVWSKTTMEKVAEFASQHIRPDKLAKLVASMGWYFGNDKEKAFVIWECNGGSGVQFTIDFLASGYRNIYWRKPVEAVNAKQSNEYAGWYQTRELKEALLGDYRRALASGEVKNRSVPAMRECLSYYYLPNGSVGVPGNPTTKSVEDTETRHGDRVIADALAVFALRKRRESPKAVEVVSPNSVGGRILDRENKIRMAQTW